MNASDVSLASIYKQKRFKQDVIFIIKTLMLMFNLSACFNLIFTSFHILLGPVSIEEGALMMLAT